MENIQILTSTLVQEENDSGIYANELTASRGLFLTPSLGVSGRPSDITGYHLVAENELGKLKWDQVTTNRVNPRGEVTQTVSSENSVTINERAGIIYTQEIDNLAIAANNTFTVYNSYVVEGSVILLNFDMDSLDPDQRPLVAVKGVTSGSFDIVVTTFTPNMVGSLDIRFIIL